MGFGVNTAVCNTILDMYSKSSDFSTTLTIFEEMNTRRDLVSWNTILSACMQHQQPGEVFNLSKLMRSSNEMDQITVSIILCACGQLSYLQMVNQVHAHALKVGLKDDLMVRNCPIDTYAKCGSLEDARKLFELMGDNHDVFSWSSLIVGYAQLGHGEQALKLFSHMKNLGIKPNHVTFVGVLTACSRIGLVDEGCHYYNVMQTERGIVPTREHCSCVIDLFARAGRLEEAERFMGQMPLEPDIITWKALLSACRSHNNMEIAKRAADGILKIDPYNSAVYVLLCNTLSSFGCWDEVATLRRSMRRIGVRKSLEKSWIVVKEEVKVFISEDRSHPETDDLYVILDVLGLEMGKAGYESKSFSWHGTLESG